MCNCVDNTSCSCNGFPQEFPPIPEGQTITSVEVNENNTITLTLSNGNTVTSENSIVIPEDPKAYVLAYNSTIGTTKTFTVPADTLTTNGDILEITIRGGIDILDGANPLIMNVDGTSKTILADPSIINAFGYVALDIKLIRNTSTQLVAYINMRILGGIGSGQTYYEAESLFEFDSFTEDSVTTIYVGQTANGGNAAELKVLHVNFTKKL